MVYGHVSGLQFTPKTLFQEEGSSTIKMHVCVLRLLSLIEYEASICHTVSVSYSIWRVRSDTSGILKLDVVLHSS